MKPVYKANISKTNRLMSTLAGGALVALGSRRSNRLLGTLGMGLLARGAAGWCPVTAAVGGNGRHRAHYDTRDYLAGTGGVNVEDAITIRRPVSEVYTFWRNLENLPRFMEHLEEVRVSDSTHSHWVAKGPMGTRVEWDAEIINDIPSSLISWKSIGDADVVSAGSVRFRPIGEAATELRVKLQYDPPAGKVGATVAWMIGEDPQHQIAEELRRVKQLLESGATAGYRATPSSQRVRRDLDTSELSTDFGTVR